TLEKENNHYLEGYKISLRPLEATWVENDEASIVETSEGTSDWASSGCSDEGIYLVPEEAGEEVPSPRKFSETTEIILPLELVIITRRDKGTSLKGVIEREDIVNDKKINY
ncbi:4989_t:CDS:1, partial [Acaulospora morrowiae]